MKLLFRFSLLVFSLVDLSSCKSTESLTKNGKFTSKKTFIKIYQEKALQPFSSLYLKSKVKTNLYHGNNYSLNAYLHLEPRKKIWASFSAFGINVAKAQITPTKIEAYEKLNKTYLRTSLSFLNKKLIDHQGDLIDLAVLENILLGRLLFAPTLKNTEITNALDYPIEQVQTVQGKKYRFKYQIDSQLSITKLLIIGPDNIEYLQIDYQNWKEIKKGIFIPTIVHLKTKEGKYVKINYLSFDFTPRSSNFNLPDSYKERKIRQ